MDPEAPHVPILRTQPHIGWRAWQLSSGLLVSHGVVWRPYQRYEAICLGAYIRAHLSVPPQMGCMCGVYAYRTLHNLMDDALDARNIRYGTVVGKVALWGKVFVYSRGYRARFAYPVSLCVPGSDTATALSKTYGVPCDVGDAYEEYSSAWLARCRKEL